jgi:hypothetical protein
MATEAPPSQQWQNLFGIAWRIRIGGDGVHVGFLTGGILMQPACGHQER